MVRLCSASSATALAWATIHLSLLSSRTSCASLPSGDGRPQQQVFSLAAPLTPSFRLSRSGIYLNSPRTTSSDQTSLELSLDSEADSPAWDLFSVALLFSPVQRRSWEDVTLRCGGTRGHGGIEACEREDVEEHVAGSSASLRCKPSHVVGDRAIFTASDCQSLERLWREVGDEAEEKEELRSVVVSVEGVASTQNTTWWIGQVNVQRSLWPIAGAARLGDPPGIEWTGTTVNRIAGVMENPYLPRTGDPESKDPLNGVDLSFATWNRGISIRVPPLPGGLPGGLLPIHSPVGGQVVWVGHYERERAPADGDNDQRGNCVMIRDQWGFVYQVFGLNKPSITVEPGQIIAAGQILGSALRQSLPREPPSHEPPADPPKDDGAGKNAPRYPYWFREVRINVARPDPEWTKWKGPYEEGWTYFNPLHAFNEGDQDWTGIPPDASPTRIFFGRRPSNLTSGDPPQIFATSTDFFTPTLRGEVELIVSFDAFLTTPGDPDDGMDPQTVYAMDWAAWIDGGDDVPLGAGLGTMCDLPRGAHWRSSFEFSKLPASASLRHPVHSVLTHVVPSFNVSSFFSRTSFASQFDEKARKLFYSPTRASAEGVWDVAKETKGAGPYLLRVRARGYLGEQGCITAKINVA